MPEARIVPALDVAEDGDPRRLGPEAAPGQEFTCERREEEINAATTETQFDAPIISTREASTQVLVKDGQTIMIGGMRDQQRDRVRLGVPLLSGLPIVGGLFGSSSDRKTSTELYLFLRPRILRTDADADSVTTPKLPRELK